MTLRAANLIPRRRRTARAVAGRLRLWASIMLGYSALLACAFAALLAQVDADASGAQADLDHAARDIEAAQADLKATRAELANTSLLLAAAREVRDHPDWSLLVNAIARIRGDDVVLGSFDLAPAVPAASAPSKSPSAARPQRYALQITGLARDHRAATTFSLSLEHTGVFSRVTLTDTASQMLGERTVVSFGLRCELADAGSNEP